MGSVFGGKMRPELVMPCKQSSTGINKARREREKGDKRGRKMSANRRKEGRKVGGGTRRFEI